MTPLYDQIARLRATGLITAEDVLDLRGIVYADGIVEMAEAEAIMSLNQICAEHVPEWEAFFVETMLDYVVHQQKPAGYVDGAKAEWLMTHLDRDGKLDGLCELELLIRVLEVANDAPASLKTYVLAQIEAAVLTGEGPTRNGQLEKGVINATEVALLRRLIFAASGEDAIVVGADEAEMLFRLKAATLGAHNDPAWTDLFVRGVGNHLMAHRHYQALTREDQLKADAWVADTSVNLTRFAGRIFGRRQSALGATHTQIEARHSEAQALSDAKVTKGEKTWLNDHIDADGQTDPLEAALLAFIAREQAEAAQIA
jgi:hypothetical protein